MSLHRGCKVTYNLFFFVLVSLYSLSNSGRIAPAFYGLERPALEYELPPLSYGFDELEPYLDETTVKVHYYQFHGVYVKELNSILKRWRRNNVKGKHVSRMSIIDILRNESFIPHIYRKSLKDYGSGLVNHNLYWATISPNPHGEQRMPSEQLKNTISSKFGSFLEFKSTFTDMALNHFGSGYVWLCRNHSFLDNTESYIVIATRNEDCPLSNGLTPILGIDVWEHAYVIKLHNHKLKYIENWWYLVDWNQVLNLKNWWTRMNFHDEL